MSNKLAELQLDLDVAQNNKVKAENEWTHIKNTASEQTLLVGKTRMAIRNLYEIILSRFRFIKLITNFNLQ